MKKNSLYQKKSHEWTKKAGVRSSSENYDLNLLNSSSFKDNLGESWHLPSYSGILNHPKLSNLKDSEKEYVRGTQLLEFVLKQTIFEIECVNYVASRLAHDKYTFKLSDSLRLDALKIYTDEGYHAYYTQKIANQIRSYYGIKEEDVTHFIGNYYSKIDSIVSCHGKDYKDLCMLAFVICGENQIVSDISEQMKNIVFEPIRVMFRDHMRDEVFHAKFFSEVFEHVWAQLSDSEKEVMGLTFCQSMEILGLPRTDIYYFSLGKFGRTKSEITSYIRDIYDTVEWKTNKIADRMSPTIQLLKENDVFENERVFSAFRAKSYL